MAFSLAGFVAGASTQALADIEDEESRVKKFYEKELDRSVAEQREMRKERRKKVEERMEQITMLESFFGGDPQARNMAAKIVAGGPTNVNLVLNTLEKARTNGATQQDLFKAVQYIPDPNAPNQSFETVKDAAESITDVIKPIEFDSISSAASKQTKGLFGKLINRDKIFNTMVQEYKDVGGLKDESNDKVIQAMKGTLKIDFTQLPTEVKSLDENLNSVSVNMNKLDKNSPTYTEDFNKLNNEKKRIIGLMNEKAIALEGTPTDTSASISVLGTNLNSVIQDAEKSIGYDSKNMTAIINGKMVSVEQAQKVRNQVVDNAKKEFLLTLVDGSGQPLNSKAAFIIRSRLKSEYEELQARLEGKEVKSTVDKKEEATKAEVDVAKNFGSPEAYVNDRIKKGLSKTVIRIILQQAYPNADINKLLNK